MPQATPLVLALALLAAPALGAEKVDVIPSDAPLAPVSTPLNAAPNALTGSLELPAGDLSLPPSASADAPTAAMAQAADAGASAQTARAAAPQPGTRAQLDSAAAQLGADRPNAVPEAPRRLVGAGTAERPPITRDGASERAENTARAVAQLRAGMTGPGYALVDGRLLLDPAVETSLLEQTRRHFDPGSALGGFNVWELYARPSEYMMRQNPAFDGWKKDPGGVRGFVESITAALRRALPDENLVAQDAQLRLRMNEAEEMSPHVDGQYITVTMALEGPGTWLYDDSGPRVKLVKAPAGQLAVITNRDRAWATGAPGTVHAPPIGVVRGRRTLLIIRYRRDGFKDEGAQRQAINQRSETRATLVQRRWEHEQSQAGKTQAAPNADGILGALKRLFN